MSDFRFTSPNRGALWSGLALTKSQLAELCGITVRQASHWTNRGYIIPACREPERYNGDAVDTCVLIKQALDHGLPLGRAVARTRNYLTEEMTRQPGAGAIVPPTLLDMREKLRGAEASIAAVLEVVEPLVPRGGGTAQPGEADPGATAGVVG